MSIIKAWQEYDAYMADVMYEWDENGENEDEFYKVYNPLTEKILELKTLHEDWKKLSEFLARRGINTEWLDLYSNVNNKFKELFEENKNV